VLATRSFVTLVVLALVPGPARAIDRFEIQVYEAEINDPGHLGLELHTNYTARGERAPAYAGEIAPDRTARFTLEPAYGVTSWLELGGYVQLLVAPGTGARYAGNKLRVKMLAPKLFGDDFFLGVNVEVGRVPVAVEQDQWANELRPFVGYQSRWLLLDLNPIIGYALSGRDRFRPELEPAAKIAVNTQLGFAVGAEYYAELGFVDALLPLRDQAHYLFGVVDLVPAMGRPDSPWEVNLAVGGGITRAADQQVIVKTIVGRGF